MPTPRNEPRQLPEQPPCLRDSLQRRQRITPESARRSGRARSLRSQNAQAYHRGNFLQLRIGGRHIQFARRERVAHADFVRYFDHHAGGGFVGLAKSEFAERRATRRRGTWREMAAQKGDRARRPARNCRRGSTPSFWSLRPCSILSASCSATLAGMAILDQRSFLNNRVGTQALWRKHQHLG